jgi:NTP pyrophosphatase (non-canonical NTP hydrolase)
MSNAITYPELVAILSKSGADILASLTPEKVHAWHMATGVAGEAGEVLDEVKKFIIYEKPEDRDKVIKEMGDLEFYLEGLRQGMGITREEVLQGNIEKLSKRYAGLQYKNEAAVAQADKN